MPILLFRVDERLIHGQVTVGWGSRLLPERYLVVDDVLARSGWEQELYRMGLPEGTSAEFLGLDEASGRLEKWMEDPVRSILLTRSVEAVLALAREGRLRGQSVNLGGLHYEPGRDEVLPYLYVGPEDRARLRELAAMGVEVEARDLPGSRGVGLTALLD